MTNFVQTLKSERGFFVIFNQETFIHGNGQKSLRHGTEHDTNKLKKVMTELGFTVRVYHDRSAEQGTSFQS